MNKEDLEELKGILLNHCYNMSILKKNAFEKKKESILDSLLISVIRANLSIEDIKECIKEVNENKIVNVEFFDNGGNLFKDYIKPKWVTFAKELFRQRSGGLGTPNSASGEGELMFLFLSNKIKKPTKGDLLINGEIVELKGEKDIRVFAEIRGNDFRKKTLEICKKFNLNPNKAKISKKEIYAVEIEKPQHLIYWEKELSKLPLEKQKDFVNEWLSCLDEENHKSSVDKTFGDGSFNQTIFIKEIVKILYSIMVEKGNFDKFIILGDGTDAKVIHKDIEEFNKKVDNGEIVPESDYFRINQLFNIGWYIFPSSN